MHVPVHRLLLPVQRLLQHQLGELVPVALRLHVQVEVAVGGDVVGAQRVRAHVGVERALHGEARARRGALGDLDGDVRLGEARRVVVDVQDLDLHAEELQRALQEHLEVQEARRALLADPLAVHLLVHEERAVLQVHLQVRRPRAGHDLELARRKFCHVQAQILRDIPHERPVVLLLGNRVVKLAEHSIHDAEQEE
uniref:Secreted protein n=1 Tax=Scleropages formosus TaxID=113540 RepID=A0A8C9SN03_SCLFO